MSTLQNMGMLLAGIGLAFGANAAYIAYYLEPDGRTETLGQAIEGLKWASLGLLFAILGLFLVSVGVTP